jgi:hypothetical protein
MVPSIRIGPPDIIRAAPFSLCPVLSGLPTVCAARPIGARSRTGAGYFAPIGDTTLDYRFVQVQNQ